jgi:hypothetical protein
MVESVKKSPEKCQVEFELLMNEKSIWRREI